MKGRVTIGLVGDRSDSVPAHLAIPLALENAADVLGIEAAYEWVPTEQIRSASRVAAFDGLWCVPAARIEAWRARCSRSAAREKDAFRFWARAAAFNTPSSNTHATSSAGRTQRMAKPIRRRRLPSSHRCRAEFSTAAARCSCSRARASPRRTDADETTEEYLCSYGVNPDFRASLVAGPLRETAQGRHRRPACRGARRSPVLRRDVVPAGASSAARQPAPLVTAFLAACAQQ